MSRELPRSPRGRTAVVSFHEMTKLQESGIEADPEICGGEPRIVHTRISIWVLVQARKLGTSEAEILKAYPTLRAEDLANAWAYYRGHRAEIEQQIRENEAA